MRITRETSRQLFELFRVTQVILIQDFQIDLIHDGRHVGFAIIMQISYTLLRGQTTQIREVITNILATQMICFTFKLLRRF